VAWDGLVEGGVEVGDVCGVREFVGDDLDDGEGGGVVPGSGVSW
jgi:hypothetical protein